MMADGGGIVFWGDGVAGVLLSDCLGFFPIALLLHEEMTVENDKRPDKQEGGSQSELVEDSPMMLTCLSSLDTRTC